MSPRDKNDIDCITTCQLSSTVKHMLPCCSESLLANEPRSYVAGLACACGTDGRAAHVALHSEATLQLVNEHHCCGPPIAHRIARLITALTPLPFQQVMSNSKEGSHSGRVRIVQPEFALQGRRERANRTRCRRRRYDSKL